MRFTVSFDGTTLEWTAIMATIKDAATLVDQLDTLLQQFQTDVDAVEAALATAKANGGISATDQAALDGAVAKLTADVGAVQVADATAVSDATA